MIRPEIGQVWDARRHDRIGRVASHPVESQIERVPVRLIGEKPKRLFPPTSIVVTHREQVA